MKATRCVWIASFLTGAGLAAGLAAPAPADPSPAAPRTLNTPRTFPEIRTKARWQARAGEIREQVLVSCGLWPRPDRTPLHAHVFGKIVRDGYSVEKVYFQTYPGFYLAGNLYRPVGKGRGPFPGILNPHGHWANGRLEDTKDGSIPARCINFARQGMVAFCYDMVGYNDTHFADAAGRGPAYQSHREFGTNRTDLLWNISLMGLQTWNSVRALDFLASLPEVDQKRLACTGASGGGTQTYMLGAIDDRLAAQAPVVMVSHTMQGGCSCENAPGLRVEYSNMEIAAAAAPRPQILVASTGDWTKDTLTVEGPALEGVYRLLGAADRLRYVRFDFGHNYNQTSREAVYAWFDRWLLRLPDAASRPELPYRKEPDADLRVFPDGQLPADALTREQFTESLKTSHQAQWTALVPRNKTSFKRFQKLMLPAWRHTLQLEWPASPPLVQTVSGDLEITRSGDSRKIGAKYFAPEPGPGSPRTVVVLASPEPGAEPLDRAGAPAGLAQRLLGDGNAVVVVTRFSGSAPADPFADFFTTYNRTVLQERVRDLVSACQAARVVQPGRPRVVLCGLAGAGLWAMLAAPAADAVVADADGLDALNDEALLSPDLLCPGLRNLGTFQGAAMLAAPHPLLLHNIGEKFPTDSIRATYRALGQSRRLRVENHRLTGDELAAWISALK